VYVNIYRRVYWVNGNLGIYRIRCNVTPRHASKLIAERGQTTWDLVALGDSTPTGYGVGEEHSYVHAYAGYMKEDLRVDVVVHNWATNETKRVADWAEAVRNNDELREDLQNAQVITIWLGWHDVIPSIIIEGDNSRPDLRQDVDINSLREVTDPMQDAFDRLISEIVSIAPPDETLILIADVGIPALFVKRCKEYGIFEIWKQYAYEVWRDYIIQAARKHNIHIVHTYEVINGPTGDQEMPSKYMQSDGLHLNKQGHRLIAALHHEIGYQHSYP
jgi:lysophospholipase L1-like esterase